MSNVLDLEDIRRRQKHAAIAFIIQVLVTLAFDFLYRLEKVNGWELFTFRVVQFGAGYFLFKLAKSMSWRWAPAHGAFLVVLTEIAYNIGPIYLYAVTLLAKLKLRENGVNVTWLGKISQAPAKGRAGKIIF